MNNTKLNPGKVTERKTLKVIAHFTNGFAQNVIQLEDGTTLFISYHTDEVTVEKVEFFTDPAVEIPQLVNSLPEEE